MGMLKVKDLKKILEHLNDEDVVSINDGEFEYTTYYVEVNQSETIGQNLNITICPLGLRRKTRGAMKWVCD